MPDLQAFNTYTKISRMIGLCPQLVKESKTYNRLSKIQLLFWCSIFICSTISAFIEKVRVKNSGRFQISLRVMDLMEVVFGFTFMVSVFRKSFISSMNWQFVYGVVVEKNDLELYRDWKKRLTVLKIAFLHVLSFSVLSFELYTWIGVVTEKYDDIGIYTLYISLAMRHYYQFILVGLIWELSALLSNRYKLLQTKIQAVFSMTHLQSRVTSPKLNIRAIKMEYTEFYRAVVNFNGIFGFNTLLFLACTVVSLLNSCFWGLYYAYADESVEYRIAPLLTSIFVSPLHNLALTTCLIMACDRVEKSGDELIDACFLLQEGMDKSDIGDELSFLIQHLQALKPKFSAAGLFYVNRKVLSTLLTFTTSYVIVILQFRN
ncbi:hypothetical protein JTB14_032747 [Gonioctena quinquepunctata]|nr:hypothetical protein JTB14_032747 [Gonioctena quinquepunctata]